MMTAEHNAAKSAGWRERFSAFRLRTRILRRRLTLLLAVVGPGVITSNVDNDAGGILVYSQAGAAYGFKTLWALIPMTFALYVTLEMCARMGAVTGKGLSDLIREEFGFRVTFFVMCAVLLVNLGNVCAEFAGVASATEIFGVSRYFSVPLAGIIVWFLVVRGTYARVEKIFMTVCLVYFSYVFSALLAKPDWLLAAKAVVVPHFSLDPGYLLILTALVGTTIAPWQHFYLQAAVVEKRVSPRQYHHTRNDVLIGSISCMVVVFFIIVCTGATLHPHGVTNIQDAGQAAEALRPLAGRWASALFALGLLNASLFAASILPLSTAYFICEGLGFESGVDRKFKEAPAFYWLYTGLIVLGGGIILYPKAPLIPILVLSQVANGVLLPFVLIFILLLVNRRDLMGDQINSRTFNWVAWIITAAMIVLTLVLAYTSVFQPGVTPGVGGP
jgi:NRAMP (natural resistance-associated macrophage protein)-like metal ion transporter